MKCNQISISRFHHFHLARQLEKRDWLEKLYTGYPRFKLRDETGIDPDHIQTFPWLHAPYMARGKIGLNRFKGLSKNWSWAAHDTLDRFVSSQIHKQSILIALAGTGLYAGRKTQTLGGIHICDSGSSNIIFSSDILHKEYQRWGFQWEGWDPRIIDKTQKEYEQSDYISVPSQFCFNSFIEQGFPPEKLIKIPYGARLEKFFPADTLVQDSATDERFRVLFVGQVSIRKGIGDLLAAFEHFSHPRKELRVIGSITPEGSELLSQISCDKIEVIGRVPNQQLRNEYSNADVFILPGIEEGFGMVIGEAMACGCPVIASTNTGASEIITDGIEGFIVPTRAPKAIAECLQQLADEPELCQQMGQAALARVQQLGGWDDYGEQWADVIRRLQAGDTASWSRRPALAMEH